MRAVWLREFGGPEVLVAGDAPDPVPGEGRVLVEVEFANITFVETQIRSGTGPMPVRWEPPVIPGNGVGGVVAAVGDGVDVALVGSGSSPAPAVPAATRRRPRWTRRACSRCRTAWRWTTRSRCSPTGARR
ncbi:alcohol dehydrogenase catalytic domain-containing protein [Actinomadura luteofluorescens]|uniref:alcohol dehydrogenase catalytic domain-containing protein n=1 Tax=Actinomadura luteofluorescens TaxID=46163 RepID=UPI003628D671